MELYVFDLDGTLANIDHRLHFIKGKKKNWDAFYRACVDDPVITWIRDLIVKVRRECETCDDRDTEILILTGRSDLVRKETLKWLTDAKIGHGYLRMRPQGNTDPDDILKPKLLDKFLENTRYRVSLIVEDRQRMADKWRELGYNVLQCAKGDF